MDGLEIPFKILLALALGAVIGLEREINEKKNMLVAGKERFQATLGLRSFSLITGLGALAGVSYAYGPAILAIFIGLGALILFASFYIIETLETKDVGITTEIALLYSFTIGVLTTLEIIPAQVVIALTVIVTLLLSQKARIKDVVEDIRRAEVNAFISYAILALVILPFLPNTSYSLSDFSGIINFAKNIGWDVSKLQNIEIINPFKLWLIVVLITGVDMAGYVLERLIGKTKGWLFASMAGGFISSTATTISLAKESKETKRTNHLLAASLFANLVSFLPVLFILATLNVALLIASFPTFVLIMASAAALGIFFLTRKESNIKLEKQKKDNKIFSLVTALRFAGLFLAVSIFSKIALTFFGQSGFLIASGVGALPGIDAVVINTAQLTGERINTFTGVLALIIINAVNLGAKAVYSFLQGERGFAIKFGISVGVIVLASLVGLLFV